MNWLFYNDWGKTSLFMRPGTRDEDSRAPTPLEATSPPIASGYATSATHDVICQIDIFLITRNPKLKTRKYQF